MKKEIEKTKQQILEFEDLIREYPLNEAYHSILIELQQKYVDLVDKIGRK